MWPSLAALAGALVMTAAFPPLGWGPLVFVAPAPWLWALRRAETGAEAIRLGLLFGSVFYGLTLWWITDLGAAAWVGSIIWLTLGVTAFGVVMWAIRLWPPWRFWLIAAGGWALWEWIAARFPFGGLPVAGIGYSAASLPGGLGAVQWIGPVGWAILAMLTAAGLALIAEDPENWRFAVDPAVVSTLLLLGGSLLAPSADGTPLLVAVVQGASPCPALRCQNEEARSLESHLQLTGSLPPGSADLVVWGENALGSPFDTARPDVAGAIAAEASRIGAVLLVGERRITGDTGYVAAVRGYSAAGEDLGEYRKRVAEPFIERTPLRSTVDFLTKGTLPARDLERGELPVVFRVVDGRVGVLIGYEGTIGWATRSAVDAGAALLVVASDESRVSATASVQFREMLRVEAAALGVDVVHVARAGTSEIIAASGAVETVLPRGEATVAVGRVALRSAGATVWSRFGNWAQLAAILVAAIAVVFPGEEGAARRRRT
jgi:apolipoprotein N-acyltransferase